MIRAILIALALFAAPAFAQAKSPLTMCVGLAGNKYDKVAQKFAQETSNVIDMKILPTAGSLDELNLMKEGKCDGAIVQSDAFNLIDNPKFVRAGDLYKEYVFLACNRDKGIKSVNDLSDKTKILIGAPGAGAAVTWANFVKLDKGYAKVPTELVGGTSALLRVTTGRDAACALFVSGLGSETMQKVNENGKKVVLVNVDDWDFNNAKDASGQLVYDFYDVPKNTYTAIQPNGVFNATGPETIAVDATIVLNADWINNNDAAFNSLGDAILRYQNQNQN